MIKLTPVEELPGKRIHHRLRDLIEGFLKGEADIVRVDIDEKDYHSPRICYSCLGIAIKHGHYPVRVHMRGKEVYLVKKVPRHE